MTKYTTQILFNYVVRDKNKLREDIVRKSVKH